MLPKYQPPRALSPSKGRPWQARNIGPKWWRSGRAMNSFNGSTHEHLFLRSFPEIGVSPHHLRYFPQPYWIPPPMEARINDHAVTNFVFPLFHSITWVPLALPRKTLPRGIAFRAQRSTNRQKKLPWAGGDEGVEFASCR